MTKQRLSLSNEHWIADDKCYVNHMTFKTVDGSNDIQVFVQNGVARTKYRISEEQKQQIIEFLSK